MPGLLSSLFDADPKQYVREGYALTQELVTRFSLPSWEGGRPQTNATDSRYLEVFLEEFTDGSNQSAKRRGGASEQFHPEFWAVIERAITDCALRIEAVDNPDSESWRGLLSLYLRAWSSGLNPWVMLSVSDILFQQKETSVAKRALNVCLLYPRYWKLQATEQVKMTALAYAMIRDYVPRYNRYELRDQGTDMFSNRLLADIEDVRLKH